MKRLTEVQKSQMVTGDLEFFVVKTPESLLPTVTREEDEELYFIQARVWERVLEIIRTRVNAVIVGHLEETGFSFAVERSGAITEQEIQDLVQSIGTMEFSKDGSDTVDLSGITIIKMEGFTLAAENMKLINTGSGSGVFQEKTESGFELRSLVGTDGIDVTISSDDETIEISGAGIGSSLSSTDDLSEGSDNLYFTDARAVSAIEPTLEGYIENTGLQTLPTYAESITEATSPEFDSSVSNVYTYTFTDGDTVTLSSPSDGNAHSMVILASGGDTATVTWPASVVWLDGTEPTLTSEDMIKFTTFDDGTTWIGQYLGSTA